MYHPKAISGGQEATALSTKDQFLAHLPFIERVIAATCRRYCLSGDEAEDFRSSVHEKFIEDDYAVFRKFRGISTVETYLTAVVMNRFRDYRIQKWGRWRPSAKARRLGPLAVRLESLLMRDGMSLDQAQEVLQGREGPPVARGELARIATQLPVRAPRRQEGEQALADIPGRESTDQPVEEHERHAILARLVNALERALLSLPNEDRVIVRMRFLDGFTVAEISRTLGLKQKSLYDRLDSDLDRLRQVMGSDGVTPSDIHELLQ